MEFLKFLRSSFPKGQWELRRGGNIESFFVSTEGAVGRLWNELAKFFLEVFPTEKGYENSYALEWWAQNLSIDKDLTPKEQYEELTRIFNPSLSSGSMAYLRKFFGSFEAGEDRVILSRKEVFVAGSKAGSLLCREGLAFSDVEVSIEKTLSDGMKLCLREKMGDLFYRYYFTVADIGEVMIGGYQHD